MELLGLKSFETTPDGQFVTLVFDTAEGAALSTQVSTFALSDLVQQFAAIVWDAAKAKPAGARPTSIPLPKLAQARPMQDRKGVFLRFEMSSRLEFVFGLDPAMAMSFQRELSDSLAAHPSKRG